ncbi:MAG: ribokinase, partial [Lachnospiraceae bacterium]|nr:ribokinase [Lachnospiraceae bacterium]
MKVLNYGSLNYDYVYAVDHMVQAGETLSSASMETHFGGKGLNQSIALARAGAQTCHAGMVGEDGRDLMAVCKESGVNTDYISLHEGRSGHAVIQINSQGENCILLFQGANGKNSEKKIKEVLSHFERGDVLLMQNEVNLPEEIIREAFE